MRSPELPAHRALDIVAKVLSERSEQVASPTLDHVPVTMVDARLEAAAAFEQELDPDVNGFVLVLDGDVQVGEAGWPVAARSPGSTSAAKSRSWRSAPPARMLLVAGAPFHEPVVSGGPFVMNTAERIRQANDDYCDCRF